MRKLLNLHKMIIVSLLTVFVIGLIVFFCICYVRCASEIKRIEKWKSNFEYPIWKQGNYYNNVIIDKNIYRVFVVLDFDISQGSPLHLYFYIPQNDSLLPIKISHGNDYEIAVMQGRIPSDKDIGPYPHFFFYSENEIDVIKQKPPEQVELQIRGQLFGRYNNTVVLVKLDAASREIQEVRIALPTASFTENFGDIIEGRHILPDLMERLSPSSFEIVDPLPEFRETPSLLPYISKTLFWRISRLVTKKSLSPLKETQIFSFILLNYLLLLIVIFLVFYVLIKIMNQHVSLKIEAFSVLSFMALILNYVVLEFLSRFREGGVGLPAVGRGDSELLSFLGGCLAVFLGHVAILKIKKNKYKGKKLAIIGLVGGYLCMSFWIGLIIVFAIGMSAF